jgi:glycosyltransferase involved in cell wall biosynthesis
MRMRVHNGLTIDARWLSSGIGTYIFNLVSGIKSFDSTLHVHLITASQHAERLRGYCDDLTVLSTPIYTLREQVRVPLAAFSTKLLHVPHYNAPLLHRGLMVVTIPDLTHLLYSPYRNRWKARGYALPMLHLAAHRADQIITVSEYSKRRIAEHLRVAPQKITTIYNGVAAEFAPLNAERAQAVVHAAFSLSSPYLLFVGNLKPHKNVGCMLDALSQLRQRGRLHHKLLIVGTGEAKSALRKRAEELGIADAVLFAGAVAQDALVAAYSAADALIMPSLHEGFGLPVIEAMACGTPVICARATSLPEVAGDAAEYFDPHSPEDLAAAIEKVTSSERRLQLRATGFARARQFTWERSVAAHCAIYRHYLN